tara:strand:+ start:2533 stop:2718 length:186 start_codon:yes stop_codon:yes gene_type:complete
MPSPYRYLVRQIIDLDKQEDLLKLSEAMENLKKNSILSQVEYFKLDSMVLNKITVLNEVRK